MSNKNRTRVHAFVDGECKYCGMRKHWAGATAPCGRRTCVEFGDPDDARRVLNQWRSAQLLKQKLLKERMRIDAQLAELEARRGS